MSEPTKRPHYFSGQLLGAEDFTLEQSYSIARRQLHNRLLHTWGIGRGLTLSFSAGATTATVSAGEAIDGLGREIVVPADRPTPDVSSRAGATLYVTIAYAEAESDPRAMGGATGNARLSEMPTIAVSTTTPADPSAQLILGRLVVGSDGKIASKDDGVAPLARRPAGSVGGFAAGGDLTVGNVTVNGSIGVGTPPTARLHLIGGAWDVSNSDGDFKIGNATYRLRVGVALAGSGAGDARIRAVGGTNRLMLGGGTNDTLTISGANVGVRNIYPAYALDVTGDIHFTGNLLGGGKGGFVMDRFINRAERPLNQGDVVVISAHQAELFEAADGRIPVPVVETTRSACDTRVCGIVYQPVDAPAAASVGVGALGWMVTLGAFRCCKVDADIAPIAPGDLLVSSPYAGVAQRVPSRTANSGAVIGKALAPLASGQGTVPILVTLR